MNKAKFEWLRQKIADSIERQGYKVIVAPFMIDETVVYTVTTHGVANPLDYMPLHFTDVEDARRHARDIGNEVGFYVHDFTQVNDCGSPEIY